MTSGAGVALLLVDDHPVVLDGMAALITAVPGWSVIGQASERAEAVRLAAHLQPDVVVLDLRMQRSYAPETVTELKRAAPGVRVLLHTATEDPAAVWAAIDAGADGAVFKDGQELVPALRLLVAGEPVPRDPRLVPHRRPDSGVGMLTAREFDLLRAFAAGKSTRAIAAELFLAESTVRSYTKSVLAKLGAHSRMQAVATARELSLL